MNNILLKISFTLYNLFTLFMILILPGDYLLVVNIFLFVKIIIINIGFYFVFQKNKIAKWGIFIIFLQGLISLFSFNSDMEKLSQLLNFLSIIIVTISVLCIITILLPRKEKTDSKIFFIINIFLAICIVIFNFGFYRQNIPTTNQSIFTTTLENTDAKNEKNLYNILSDFEKIPYNDDLFKLEGEFIDCIYNKHCANTREEYKTLITKLENGKIPKKFHTNTQSKENFSIPLKIQLRGKLSLFQALQEQQTFNENFEKWLLEVDKGSFYKNGSISEKIVGILHQDKYLLSRHRGAKYYIILLLKNNQEDQAIQTLISLFDLNQHIFNGDGMLLETMIANRNITNLLQLTETIIDNFSLSEQNKIKLKNTLQEIDSKKILTNSLKVEHKFGRNSIKTLPDTMSLFNLEKTNRVFDIILKDKLENDFVNSEKIQKQFGKVHIFRDNIIGQILYFPFVSDDSNYKIILNRLENTETLRKKIVEKLKK